MEKHRMFRFAPYWLMPLAALGCAGTDEIQPEDVTTADLSAEPVDDGVGDAFGPPMDGPPPRPPQEAFAACEGLAAGAACSVAVADRAALDGTCREGPPGEEQIVCVPANLPPPPPRQARGHRGPPRVAIDACANLAADAACSFEIDGHAIDGTCRQGPGGPAALACAPANLPPPPAGRGGPPREALAACANLAADAACSFQIEGHAVDGTCWAPPVFAGAPLACAPPEIRNGFAPPSR